MGHAKWDPSAWSAYARATRGKSRSELFTSTRMKAALNPAKIKMRESRDSDEDLASTPIIVGIDVTGSMGMLAEALVKRGLKPLFEEILDRKPVTDPHVMAMAIGDAYYDRAPLEATQFEADLRIVEQLRELWLEGGGGGNRGESYSLAHAFAGLKTATDAYELRGKRGLVLGMVIASWAFLAYFTMGSLWFVITYRLYITDSIMLFANPSWTVSLSRHEQCLNTALVSRTQPMHRTLENVSTSSRSLLP